MEVASTLKILKPRFHLAKMNRFDTHEAGRQIRIRQ